MSETSPHPSIPKLKVSGPDTVDYKVKKLESSGRMETLSIGALGLGMIVYGAMERGDDITAISHMALGTAAFLGATIGAYKRGINLVNEQDKTNQVENKQIGYFAERLVYRGKTPITVDGKEFKKGEGFYTISLPWLAVHNTSADAQSVALQMELHNFSLREIKQSISNYEYGFVAIKLTTDVENTLGQKPNSTRAKILSGKGAKTFDPEQGMLTLSREQFEALTVTPNELFEKALRGLGDPILIEQFELARAQEQPEQRRKVGDLFLRRLSFMLSRDVESRFNALPNVSVRRTPDTHAPIRERGYMHSQVKKTASGYMFVQSNASTGEVKSTPLEELLKMKGKDVEEMIADRSTLRRPQLALYMKQMTDIIPFEDLVTTKPIDEETLLKRVSAFMVTHKAYNFRGLPESIMVRDTTKARIAKARSRAYIEGAMASGGIFGAFILATIGGNILRDTGVIDLAFENNAGNSGYEDLGSPEVGFGGPRGDRAEWQIGGNLSKNGIFVTGTSNKYENKQWVPNTEVDEEVFYPAEPGELEDRNYLSLSRIQEINQLQETNIKLPIRDNTRLFSLNIKGPEGAEIDYKVFRLRDGSIQIKFPNNIINPFGPAYASIDAYFESSDTSMVHATTEVAALDSAKLSSDVKRTLEEAEKYPDGADVEFLRSNVAVEHKYSVDPVDKAGYESAKSPEDVVNAIEDLSACNCGVCNTQFVLEANTIDTKSIVNFSFGFLNADWNPGGASGDVLRSATSHGFGIDENGVILDATASAGAADDQATKDYLALLKAGPGALTWDGINGYRIRAANEQKEESDRMKLMGILLGSSIGLIGLSVGYRRLRKDLTPEKVRHIADGMFASSLSRDEFGDAYSFYNWISWGKPDSKPVREQVPDVKNGREALKKIRGSINSDKLTAYLESPDKYEGIARSHGFSVNPVQGLVYRVLASYLLTK